MKTKTSQSGLTSTVEDNEKLSQLEANIARLSELVEKSTNLMVNVSERVDGIEEKIKQPQRIPLVESPEARIEAMKQVTTADGKTVGQSQRVQDFLNPRGQDSGFQTNDIVRLSDKADSVALNAYRLNASGEPAQKDEEGEQALGAVVSYMYTRRDGQRKYKVNFPKFGKSGFLERELVLVKAV